MIKDLDRIGRDLNNIINIDNNMDNYRLTPQNNIKLKSWFGDKNDSSLFIIMKYLLCKYMINKN